MRIELNYKVEFTHVDTSFEPASVSYSEMFSWQGIEFPKRPNEHDQVTYRQKRNTKQKKKSLSVVEKQLMFDSFSKPTVTPEEGVFIVAENVTIIDDYLYGSPRMPFRANRRIFVIAITQPEEWHFEKRVRKMLRRLWQDYAVADAILITPCSDDPEVGMRISFGKSSNFNFFCVSVRYFIHFSHLKYGTRKPLIQKLSNGVKPNESI